MLSANQNAEICVCMLLYEEQSLFNLNLSSILSQLDCRANVTARGVDHMTPLSVAAQKGSAEIMALFFKKCKFTPGFSMTI